MIIPVRYVSVWDGDTEIHTNAEWDTDLLTVVTVDTVDTPSVESLDREYIILPNGEEIEVDSSEETADGIPIKRPTRTA